MKALAILPILCKMYYYSYKLMISSESSKYLVHFFYRF
jgi:hypothetical protein